MVVKTVLPTIRDFVATPWPVVARASAFAGFADILGAMIAGDVRTADVAAVFLIAGTGALCSKHERMATARKPHDEIDGD